MSVIESVDERCKSCYSCLRACPVKAIKVEEAKAKVIDTKCIYCGSCVKHCPTQAKFAEYSIETTREFFQQGERVIACLDPTFPVAFESITPQQLVASLKKIGFTEVIEGAFGGELVIQQYQKLLQEKNEKPIISSICPAVVSYVEKYVPSLIPYLAPIVSPMIAMGRMIKGKYAPEAKVVYIGPCIAKKWEVQDEEVQGAVDAVLTFAELQTMLKEANIDPTALPPAEFDGPQSLKASLLPLPGSLVKSLSLPYDILNPENLVVTGKQGMKTIFKDLQSDNLRVKFLELLYCHGCTQGPRVPNKLTRYGRRELLMDHVIRTFANHDDSSFNRWMEEYGSVDLSRGFTDRFMEIEMPTEKEIKWILRKMGKRRPEDELNCKVCGYDSCRSKAIAVCQGFAELEMCLPYLAKKCQERFTALQRLHHKLKEAQEQLIQSEKLISMGKLAASVAHEINNPISGVLTYIKLMLKKVDGKPLVGKDLASFRKYLNIVAKETSRCGSIVRSLLEFARQSELKIQSLDVNSVLKKTIALLEHQMTLQDIKLTKNFKPLPEILADFSQLQQVFLNIMLNAIQVMPDGGEITVSTVEGRDGFIDVRISDTGCGIPKENLPKLFDPFFTTKKGGKGIGLGLSVVYGIINRHKGKIEIESEVGKGSTFIIRLPRRGAASGSYYRSPPE